MPRSLHKLSDMKLGDGEYIPPPPGVLDVHRVDPRRKPLRTVVGGALIVIGVLGAPLAGALFGIYLVTRNPGPNQSNIVLVPVFFMGPALLVIGISVWTSVRRDRRELSAALAADLCACIYCRYDLSALGDSGICPECASPFTRDQTRRSWVWTYQNAMEYEERIRYKAEFPDLFRT